jgi:hypothetical protein
MDLFPELPEDLASLSDEELGELLKEHEVTAELIEAEDEEYIKGMSADEVIAALELGVEQIEKIVAEQAVRVEQQEAYEARKAELAERRRQHMASEEAEEAEAEEAEEEEAEAVEDEAEVEEAADEEVEEEAVEATEETALVASATNVVNRAERRPLRRPPAPSASRLPSDPVAVLTAASGLDGIRGGQPLDRKALAEAMRTVARRLGPPAKSENGIEQRFFVAQANFPYPDERRLAPGELDVNASKIAQVIPDGITGLQGNKVLTASGGLCAPLEPFYTMPNFASTARPVREALPSFQADRGGVSVPEATIIGDIDDALTMITADEDAAGTYTKSCQDLECPDYTDVAVVVLAHCREYGNLNARAWPEKIAHENDLTMAALARMAEGFLLDRIKAQSIEVTSSTTLGAMIDLVDSLVRAAAGIRYRLRMNPSSNFRALMPAWVPDLLVDDTIRTQFAERFANQNRLSQILNQYGINVSYYLDTPGSGTTQGFANEVAATAVDDFPATVQYALFPEGAFLHLDGGTLDLGIVRDSTLNSTNDFQIFGEIFENVVRIAPSQAALWVELTTAPTGQFPALV